MLFTLEIQHPQADNLSFLLHKHPGRLQSFELSFGLAHVFYPEHSANKTQVAVVLEVDQIGLVRRKGGQSNEGFSLSQYVNNRGYVASSFLSVALAELFGTAMNGRCKDRPESVETVFPITSRLAVLPSWGGERLIHQLFEPLGYSVDAQVLLLDPMFPEWGNASFFQVTLCGEHRVQDVLQHLYVLIPVLDNEKHYWVSDDEVAKLLKRGEGWLPRHPLRDLIVNRYLKFQKRLTNPAIERLVSDLGEDPADDHNDGDDSEQEKPNSTNLNALRLSTVLSCVKDSGARRVLDLGCGEGALLRLLLQDGQFIEIVGMDVSHRALEKAALRLSFDRLPDHQKSRIKLIHGSLIYRDDRLKGFDAAALVEVIEHLDRPRLAALERNLFNFARPGLIFVTTPNSEYNARFPALAPGQLRHKDHRFEWTRSEFQAWAENAASANGYSVELFPIGDTDPVHGPPTQLAKFTKEAS